MEASHISIFCDSPTNSCSKPDESLMLLKRFFICYYRQNGLHREAPPERGTFSRLQVYQMVGSFLVSSGSNPRLPAKLFFLTNFFLNEFFIFSSESTHKAITFPGKKFWFRPKAVFLMIISSLRNLPPFCSTICISLLSPWRSFKNSYSSQAKWFGWMYLSRSWKMYL